MIHQALKNLGVVGDYYIAPNGSVSYASATKPQPTNAQIESELVNVLAAQNAVEYKRLRAQEYAQVHWDDLRFNDMRDSTTTEYDTRVAIKLKYPKPI